MTRRPIPRIVYLVPLLFGLTPLLWFRPGFQLASEDMDLVFDPAHWWPLWQSWNSQYNAGVNYSFALASQGFHALPAFLHGIGVTGASVQKVQWVCWFTLQGVGMTWLMTRVVRARHLIVATWVAVSFYLFNLYQETVWLSMDIAKVSAYAVLPFLLAQCLQLVDGAISMRRAAVTIALGSLLGAGMGVNPPVLLVVIGAVALVILAHLATRHAWRPAMWPATWRVIRQTLGVSAIALVCHAFWLLPLVARLRSDMPTAGQAVSLDWLSGTSANTSFANVCRLRGDWTWYQGWQEPYRPYAASYDHWWLVALGWAIPLVVLYGVLSARHRHKLGFFLLTLFGLILSMGEHPPMKLLYRWLTTHVPLFWTFRSPWHKFTLWTCVGYAVFLGLAASEWYERLAVLAVARQGRRVLWWLTRGAAVASVVLLIAANIVYAFPVSLGKMYTTAEERKFLPPNHIRIPPYVWEAARWFDQQQAHGFFRLLALPESESWTYTWGLGSASPALLYVGISPVLFPMHVLGVAPEQPLLRTFYRGLYRGSSPRLAHILRMLNVRYLVHETDIKYWIPAGDTDDPPFIRAALARQEGLTRGPTFGAWESYEVPQPLPRCYYVPKATLVVGDTTALIPMTRVGLLETPACVMTSTTPAETLTSLLSQHAFDRLVVAPGTSLPSGPLPEGPLYLVASSDQLTREVDATQAQPLVPWSGFSSPTMAGWRPLESNSAPNWSLQNSSMQPQALQLSGTVRSPVAPRSLYAYLDGQLLQIYQVPAEAPTIVMVPATIPPGTHTVSWYSPDARTLYPDGRQVGFEFANDWRVGPPAWEGTFAVPRAGKYEVWLSPGTPPGVSQTPTLRLAGHPVSLTPHAAVAPGTWRAAVSLEAARCHITLLGTGDTPYTLILTPKDQAAGPSTPGVPLLPTLTSATAYRLPPTPGPGWIIFSEAFHQGWSLRLSPGPPHVVMNGFANGYYLARPSPKPCVLEFVPQRWVWLGGAISIVALCVICMMAIRKIR